MHVYGLIIGLSVVIYYHLTHREWVRAGIQKEYFTPLFIGVIFLSLLGARFYHVTDNFEYYRTEPWQIAQIWNGGLGVVGALVFAFCFLFFDAKFYHLSSWMVFNIFSTHLLLALGIGRLANLFSDGGFWLESIPLLIAYFIYIKVLFSCHSVQRHGIYIDSLFQGNGKRNKTKVVICPIIYFLFVYGLTRILSDHFRSDLWYTTNNLPVSTIIAFLMVLGGLTLLVIQRVRSRVDGQI